MVVVPNVVHMLVNLQEMTKTNLLAACFTILQLAGVLVDYTIYTNMWLHD